MSNPRIEEVDDDDMADDPEEMDLDAFDFARPQQGTLGANAAGAADSELKPDIMQALLQGQQQHSSSGSTAIPQMPRMSEKEKERYQREQQEKSKHFQCIYPVYFDSTRSREQGRRVRKEDAVPNPLAREIIEGLAHIGQTKGIPLQLVLEPMKTHPKDWANPGRVKVLVKQDGKAVSSKVQNKHHLYKIISDYLKTHPTTQETPKKLQIQGLPMPKSFTPDIPRGQKMGSILPPHSPALSGGGVSENMFKDMMAEMGGALPAGLGGGDGSSSGQQSQQQKKGKDKKKK